MRSRRNIEVHELIGLQAEVKESTNPNQVGIKGRIVDETYHMLVLDDGNRRRMIMKNGARFGLWLGDEYVTVKGDRINYRPHERIKKLTRRRMK
jgi:ribonuclease P protein subunit POP4